MKQRYVVMDLETTGNSPKKQDKIIQVGAVLIEDGEIIERFASFVNPSCKIPPFIEQLTSINNDMVTKAPTFEQIAPMLNEMLEGSALVAHNVPFDLSFLQHELKVSGYPAFTGNTIDTVELARILLPTRNSYKLTDLADFYELSHDNPHRADSDAEVTANIFLKLLEKIKSLPSTTNRQLHELLHNMKSDIYILFKEEFTKVTQNQLIYQDKIALKQPTTIRVEDYKEIKETILFSSQKIEDKFIGAEEIRALFTSRQHGLLEMSPSLTNKEDHLLGALLYSLETGKKVVVSAHNPKTREKIQVFLTEIHKTHKNCSFLTASIKGKYFYLSLPRFLQTLEDKEDNYDAVLTKAQILVWLTETETGDMEEISLSSGGKLLWESINCAVSQKMNEDTTYCFYQKAMEKLEHASLILTNHSFLAKEIWKEEILKECNYFVVEDANVFYHNVSKFLGKEISYLDIYFALSKLPDSFLTQQAKEELDEMFRLLRSYCMSKTKGSLSRVAYRFDILKEKGATWLAVQEATQRLYMKLSDIIHHLGKQKSNSVDSSNENSKQNQVVLQTMKDTLYSLMFVPNKSRLTWFEVNVRGAKNSLTIYEQPLDISLSLAEKFYQIKKSVIFVSPALSVNHNFDFMMEELGLSDFYPKTIAIEEKNTQEYPGVFIPTDMPYISKGKNETFIQISALQIKELLAEKGGRILVAFSSIEMLSAVYTEIKNLPNSNETVIVSQSSISGGKQKILKAAANFERAILLVTNSFLEEVSINNEQIDTLVIIRLPFKAMEEPIMAAKIERVEKQGRNSFTDVSLPIAVLRFKKMLATFLEGDGSKDVFIFDRRIIDKRYGEQFIEAIPNGIVQKDSFFTLINNIN
ncbi:exonuclease domain-containing protein [Sutcliffiella halmapala]|uniref:exonuclease domain-containing protein n=1 Tax=Sutcliffiella halmapala TaxID=79882 RepID=UPI0014764005|nr:exonuclease domain-containing protein [Sutcliffiella halmapala]